MIKSVKIFAWILTALISLVMLFVIGYVIYMSVNYYRIDDFLAIETNNPQTEVLKLSEEYTALTYNIGFGAYNHEFSFFMDSGAMNDGTEVSGSDSVAKSKEVVLTNTNGTIDVSKNESADFYLFQEVDTKSTRSHNVNQYEMIENSFSIGTFPKYSSVYAVNFHSSFMLYPFNEPHGIANSGVLTLSKYKIDENIRRKYPIDESFFTKFFDLDRCFLVSRLPVENGKELVLINSHMSAYDEGGLIREKQLELINNVMKEEYDKGNYVIVGGDFNHDIAGMAGKFKSEQQIPEWVYTLDNENLTEGFSIVVAENYNEVPTCRSTDIPYTKGINYSSVLDGFIVSDNVEATAKNIDADFEYSDHNPALLRFKLK